MGGRVWWNPSAPEAECASARWLVLRPIQSQKLCNSSVGIAEYEVASVRTLAR